MTTPLSSAFTWAALLTLGLAGQAVAQAPLSPPPPPEPGPDTTGGFSDDFLPGFLTAGGALDAADPDIVATIRLGIDVGPAYFGSDEYELGPNFVPRFDLIRFPGGFEFGSSQAVGFRTGPGLQGSVRYIGRRNSDDYAAIEGLDDVQASFELGLGATYEQRNYRFFANARYGVIGHNTWVGELGADGISYPVDGLTLTAGPRVQLGSNQFTGTYFGVTPSEAEDSDLPAFDADGGVYAAGMEVSARYLFNERWGVEGIATYNRLLNDAADSPITEAGSADQYEFRLGITRRISLDF